MTWGKWILGIVAGGFLATSVSAHMLWVNLYESRKHAPGHALVSLGWGTRIPMDDFTGSQWARLDLDTYHLLDPAMRKTALPVPESVTTAVATTPGGLEIRTGDPGILKIPYTKTMAEGVYQVVAASADNYVTVYLDEKGGKKMVPKPKSAIRDASRILHSMKYRMTGKAFFRQGVWQRPEPAGLDVEVIPLDDLTALRAGDRVSFEVRYMGKPVSTGMAGHYTMTLTSNTFGGPDGYFLGTYVHEGRAGLRIPTAGQWVAHIVIRKDVDLAPELAHLKKDCDTVLYGSSISFEVAP